MHDLNPNLSFLLYSSAERHRGNACCLSALLLFCTLSSWLTGDNYVNLFFFQAIAKLNLPHKLIGQQLQSEGDGLKEKTKESNRKREGQRQTTRKATEQMKNSATASTKIIFKLCWGYFFSLNNMFGGLDWHFSWEGAAVFTVWGGEWDWLWGLRHLLSRPTQPFSALACLISSTMFTAGGSLTPKHVLSKQEGSLLFGTAFLVFFCLFVYLGFFCAGGWSGAIERGSFWSSVNGTDGGKSPWESELVLHVQKIKQILACWKGLWFYFQTGRKEVGRKTKGAQAQK